MLSQQDYFPMYTTLLEVICFPREVPTDPIIRNILKSKIIKLLKEAKIDQVQDKKGKAIQGESIIDLLQNDTEVINWNDRLSGGQKKKVSLISAILHNPGILILDEAFVGLDERSIPLMQKMLKKYLPNTMKLVVDHHGLHNNNLGDEPFYDHHHHFANHKVVEKDDLAVRSM
jgi:ABC-type uncharacterized transport system fused permease/ATPase subunit